MPLEASEMPVLRRHVVLVFVDRLDLATARAIQYARSLDPDEVRAVHFLLDNQAAQLLKENWERLMIRRLPLEIRECRDRRLGRAAVELVAVTLADGDTEVSVLLPRRLYSWAWGHLLHDRTADRLAAVVGRLPHANATVVPFQVGKGHLTRKATGATGQGPPGAGAKRSAGGSRNATMAPPRSKAPSPWARSMAPESQDRRAHHVGRGATLARRASLELHADDRTGTMTLVFTRRDVPGVETGRPAGRRGHRGRARGPPGDAQPSARSPEEDSSGPDAGLVQDLTQV